jgi:hypothetical protein
MILSGLRRDTEVGANERGPELRDELLGGIAGVAPALATEVAVESRRMASPVGESCRRVL